MKIKDLIATGKITNISRKDFNEEDYKEFLESEKDENTFVGKDYVFHIYEGRLFKNKKMNMIMIVGSEDVLIYNTKTKKFWEEYAR